MKLGWCLPSGHSAQERFEPKTLPAAQPFVQDTRAASE
jgi:hypothetical protein